MAPRTHSELSLITRIARLYHEEELTQTQIAEALGLSQVAVSRLLKKAAQLNIVRTTVVSPPGIFSDLEDLVREQFSLQRAIVVGASRDSEEAILPAIGSSAAHLVESTLRSGEIIGLASGSKALLAMVDQMHPLARVQDCTVVQIQGGVGNPSAEKHAHHLVTRFARLVHGDVRFLPTPGIVSSGEVSRILMQDPAVRQTLDLFPKITLALVGVGAPEPSEWVPGSGNVYSESDARILREAGAAGDIVNRFFDKNGVEIGKPFGDRIIAITLEQLRRIRRCVGIAGGARKVNALLGALRGKYINILVTDQFTADRLLKAA
ncbi:MAG TPA: sugar-binding transcriptional regulator [Chthoniobacterales bacterium]